MIERIKDWWRMYVEPADEQDIKLNHAFEEKEPSKRKMRKRINTLEGQVETLESVIKDELFRIFMDKLGEPQKVERLENENKQLRKKIKLYKEMIMEDHNGTRRSNGSSRKVSKKTEKRSSSNKRNSN